MRQLILTLCFILLSVPVFSHDGHHAPASTDAGKYGGVVAPVVKECDIEGHPEHIKPVYKAELIRSQDQTVRVYLFDDHGHPLDLKDFETTASAVVEIKRKGKFETTPFKLTMEKNYFIGKAPKAQRKPFNIEITFKDKKEAYFVSFGSLD